MISCRNIIALHTLLLMRSFSFIALQSDYTNTCITCLYFLYHFNSISFFFSIDWVTIESLFSLCNYERKTETNLLIAHTMKWKRENGMFVEIKLIQQDPTYCICVGATVVIRRKNISHILSFQCHPASGNTNTIAVIYR